MADNNSVCLHTASELLG